MVLDENFTQISVSTQTEAENDRLYQSIIVMLVTDCRVTACLPSFWSVTSTEHNSTRAIFHARYRVISLVHSMQQNSQLVFRECTSKTYCTACRHGVVFTNVKFIRKPNTVHRLFIAFG